MSNVNRLIGVITGIGVCLILIYAGNSILEAVPESDEPEGSIEEKTENLPREIGWAFLIGGVIGLILILLGVCIAIKKRIT